MKHTVMSTVVVIIYMCRLLFRNRRNRFRVLQQVFDAETIKTSKSDRRTHMDIAKQIERIHRILL